jgi:NADH-quinone oxidoreductase subunit N
MFLTPEHIQALQSGLLLDLQAFLPELVLCGGLVLLLLFRLMPSLDRWHLGAEALTFTFIALAIGVSQWRQPMHLRDPEAFAGMLAYDDFTLFFRVFLIGFTTLVVGLSMLTGIPDREDSADFYCLLLGATVGMSLMASANHLLMVYLGVEMASVPSYALAGFLKGKRQGGEAALKYVVYGGGASGVMLYGISLVAGKFGTAHLPDLARLVPQAFVAGPDLIVLLGLLFILVGIGFKLAAFPFHFWCPDVFEGAAAEVAGFLSVASKGAALALLARLTLSLMTVGEVMPFARYAIPTLALIAALTTTFGNLAAFAQTNFKRLLAYSTIAQAGTMLMALVPLTLDGASAVLLYLVAYLFMNLGAFAVAAFLRNLTGSENLTHYRGMLRRAPVLVIALAVFLLGLLGVPPLVGFAAKFQVFLAVYRPVPGLLAQGEPALATWLIVLFVLLGLNTVLSAFYYLRVLKIMMLERPIEELEGREVVPLPVATGPAVYATLLAVVVGIGIIVWGPVADAADQAVLPFKPMKTAPAVAAQVGDLK